MSYIYEVGQGRAIGYDLGVCRFEDYQSESFDFHGVDLTGATLNCYISLHPDATTRLATFTVNFTVESNTYQQLIDAGRFTESLIPNGSVATDTVTTTVISITGTQAQVDALPRSQKAGDQVVLYYSLIQTAPTADVLMAGRFYVTEVA